MPNEAAAEILLGAAILAAGRSRRMGRPKLLLPWRQGTVLAHLLNVWTELGAAQIVVVRAADDSILNEELLRLGVGPDRQVLNPSVEDGMFGSIQCAARWPAWQPALTHIALVLGDQPHVRTATLRSFLDQSARATGAICQPQFRGRLHHPVLFPSKRFSELATFPGPTLKHFLQGQHIIACPVDDEGLGLDLDRPEDYVRALARSRVTDRD